MDEVERLPAAGYPGEPEIVQLCNAGLAGIKY